MSVAGASSAVGHRAHCFISIVRLTEDAGPEGWSACLRARAEGQSTSPLHRSLSLPVRKEELRPCSGASLAGLRGSLNVFTYTSFFLPQEQGL